MPKRTTKPSSKPAGDYVFQFSVTGIDEHRRDSMLIVRGWSAAEFLKNVAAVKELDDEIIRAPEKFRGRDQARQDQRTTAAPAARDQAGPARKKFVCPNCGGDLWDNRGRKAPLNHPHLKCKSCKWFLVIEQGKDDPDPDDETILKFMQGNLSYTEIFDKAAQNAAR
jgi:hypothetical protein